MNISKSKSTNHLNERNTADTVDIGESKLFHRKTLKTNKMTDRKKPVDGFNDMMTSVANSNPFGKNITGMPKNNETATKRMPIELDDCSAITINALLRRITQLENDFEEYKNYVENTFAKTKNMEKELDGMEERIMRSID